MSTRSAIGIRYGTIIKAVYCHWDGYVEHNGAILQEHYNSVKTNKLLSLGDLSSLRPEIGEAHPFSKFDTEQDDDMFNYEALYGNMCTFYGRDRGESNTEFTTHNSIEEFREEYRSRCCEYFYLLEGDRWTYSHYSSDEIKDLASAVTNINLEETV